MSTIKSSDEHLTINADGSGKEVKIQRDGTEVLATTSTGIDVTGSVTCEDINTSGELNLTAASNNYIDYTDALHIRAAGSSPAYEDSIYCVKDSQVEIKHNGSTKLATTSSGIDVTGTVDCTTVDLGNWTVTESAGVLYFATSGTNKMKLDASGNLTVTGNVTGYGTI